MYESSNPRQQRASLSFPYLEPYADGLSLGGQSPLPSGDINMDEAWDLFRTQSPQCISQDQGAFGTFRTPHDDLCAHPPKCPTAGHIGFHGGHNSNASSHMMFHTRHFDPQAMTGFDSHMQQAVPAEPHIDVMGLVDYNPGSFFNQNMTTAANSSKSVFTADEFAEQLSALSSPPTRVSTREGEDGESTCDSECGFGTICHDTVCSEDPSACCEDESCLQTTLPPTSGAITSEDAIAAAALTSFLDQQKQANEQRMAAAATSASGTASSIHSHHHQGHHHSISSDSADPCLQFSMGPDLCISPQFLMNYQHLREAHDPLNPSVCSAPICPVDDPSFYQECHIRHTAQNQCGMFDNIDLNLMMCEHSDHNRHHCHNHGHDHNHNHSSGHSHSHGHNHNHHFDAAECGARFPNGEAMIQHLFNAHGTSLNMLQFPTGSQPPGMDSSTSPSVSMSSQDLARTPSLTTPLALPDASVPLASYDFGMPDIAKDKTHRQVPIVVPMIKGEALDTLGARSTVSINGTNKPDQDQAPQTHECLWCDSVGGQACKQVFESASDLHKHVLVAHTHLLKRDVGGTYSCGWHGCTRRDGDEKGGFVQKSKIDRHMQVHTGSRQPFTCDICHQSFSANQALLQHKLIHEDSKPLSCDICGKTFRQHSALTMHIRTHTKVRPLKCPYCHKEFSESSNLSKHKRIHTGDGQYECKFPGCNRTFHRKDQLRRHGTQHSKIPSSGAVAKPSSLSVSPTTAIPAAETE